MEILKHKGTIMIITQNPSETRHEVNEAIYQDFRNVFSDDLAVGENDIQFSGRRWGLFGIINSLPLSLIDQGEIYLEEFGHSVRITYSLGYKQFAIMWTIIAIVMFITMLTLFFINIVPFFIILGPLLIFCMLAVMMGVSIIRFESLLDECLFKVKGNIVRIPV